MKKRVCSIFLAAAMTATLLTGCGGRKTVENPYTAQLPTTAEANGVYVEKVEGLSTDFVRGMDVSIVLAEEASGVKYYNEDGTEEDLFKILADSGVNYARVRVWNDPYDEDGNGYGGGNCDTAKAAEIAYRAATYGMKTLVDYHYSDFWADPSKQMVPKAWKELDIDKKAKALYKYTKESLTEIIKAGGDIGMVQIGNEINNGLAGEKKRDKMMVLLEAASKAVREVSKKYKMDIQIAVHFTNVDDVDGIYEKAQWINDSGLDYDIFGISYYPYWHGTMDNMKTVLSTIKDTYGKETMILETAFPFTGEDGDANGNSVSAGDITGDQYRATVQSQATAIRDIIAAANDCGASGVFYWEGDWVPVGSDYTTNSVLWEKYGSGWASSFSAAYDPKDAGKYYGGSSWDNQAMFDFSGKALPSLNVFKYVYTGTVTEPSIDFLADCSTESSIGDPLVMPEGVWAVYNDRSLSCVLPTTWNAEEVAAIDTNEGGLYTVGGVTADGQEVTCDVKIAFINFLENPSFEDGDVMMWKVDAKTKTDYQTKASDATTGERAFHWWDTTDQEFEVEQTVSGLAAGTYTATAQVQGGDVGNNANIYLYVKVGEQVYTSEPVELTGWVQWKEPTISGIELDGNTDITVGMHVECASNGWGTIDDFMLHK